MTGAGDGSNDAFRVGGRIRARTDCPWDVYAESLHRYEVHLNGSTIEMVRGPIRLEGYGIRLLCPKEGQTAVGFAAATDFSDSGIDRTLSDAGTAGVHGRFPARKVELPSNGGGAPPVVETIDRMLWAGPEQAIDSVIAQLLSAFDGRRDVVPSFGSIRATLGEATLVNSTGIECKSGRTSVSFELAVKAQGGPEGAPPGEYWVTRTATRLDDAVRVGEVDSWCRKAQDVRQAAPTPSGDLSVVLPTDVLADILPTILGYRLGGASELRGMMPPVGSEVGPSELQISDDGLFPFGLGSGPWDDEGTVQRLRRLVADGKVHEPLYDRLHASALGKPSAGAARRGAMGFASWFRFASPPAPGPATVVVEPGDAGSEEEIVESVGDGLWVDQLGYAFPDPVSSAFGGEIRLGYRIQNGQLGGPVRGGTVGGVLLSPPATPSVLRAIVHIGSKPTLVGQLSSPALAVNRMAVAGG